ncbi:hypothetical protein D3C80_180140 [compost metagenome]
MGDGRLHGFDEFGTLFLQVAQRHGRGNRAQAVNELRLDQGFQRIGIICPVAKRLGGERDIFGVRFYAHIKFGGDIGAHAILGDQRFMFGSLHFQPQRAERDPGIGVEDRQNDCTAVEYDFFAAKAGSDIGLVARRARIKRCHDDADDDDRRDDGTGNQAQRKEVHGELTPVVPAIMNFSDPAVRGWPGKAHPPHRRSIPAHPYRSCDRMRPARAGSEYCHVGP